MLQFQHTRNYYGFSILRAFYVHYYGLDYPVDCVNYHVIVKAGGVSSGHGYERLIGQKSSYPKLNGYGF